MVGVFTARNEGKEIRPTVESWLQSFDDVPNVEPIPVVVDDASTDGSCENLPWKVVRHHLPWGVGLSRNDGASWAIEEEGADILSFHDAHMRFPKGVMASLGEQARKENAIVTSVASGWWKGKNGKALKEGDAPIDPRIADEKYRGSNFGGHGADLYWDWREGFQSKYRGKTLGEWTSVACPMGACYVMSVETAHRLIYPTGCLWENIKGIWGFSEEGIAIKAFLVGIPVIVSSSLKTHHLYKSGNPAPGAGVGLRKNTCYVLSKLFSEKTFNARFREGCRASLGEKESEKLINEARSDVKKLIWNREKEGKVFTRLVGREADGRYLHPDHEWIKEIYGVKLEDTPSVLQWRPSEATISVRKRYPNASITCIEWEDYRYENWESTCDYYHVALHKVNLSDWPSPPNIGGKFDMILIGGDFPEKCQTFAEKHLSPNGTILVDPTKNWNQVNSDVQKNAKKKLSEFVAEITDG
jgi:hypothetical protein